MTGESRIIQYSWVGKLSIISDISSKNNEPISNQSNYNAKKEAFLGSGSKQNYFNIYLKE